MQLKLEEVPPRRRTSVRGAACRSSRRMALDDQLLSAREVARIRRCSVHAIQNAIRDGELDAVRIYGFRGRVIATGVRRREAAT